MNSIIKNFSRITGDKLSSSTSMMPVSKPGIMILEPRILLDAAMVATISDAVVSKTTSDGQGNRDNPAVQLIADVALLTPASQQDANQNTRPDASQTRDTGENVVLIKAPTEVVFIDSSVAGSDAFLADIPSGAEIVFLNGDSNGLTQMANWLDGRNNIGAIHIISHGGDGQVQLGDTTVTNANLAQFTAQLAEIGSALSETGDILFYGCNLGASADGLAFIDSVAQLTGADIAASDDLTGAANLGGDAQLEIVRGTVETSAILTQASLDKFGGTLATITVTSAANSGAGTLRQALVDATAGDTITFDTTASGMNGTTVNITSTLTITKQLYIDGDVNNDNAFTSGTDVTIDANWTGKVMTVNSSVGSSGNEVLLFGLGFKHGLDSGSGTPGQSAGNFNGSGVGAVAGGAGLYVGVSSFVNINHSYFFENRAAGGGGGSGHVTNSITGYGGGGGGGYIGVGTNTGGGRGGLTQAGSGNAQFFGRYGSNGTGGRGGYNNNGSYQANVGLGGSATGGAGGVVVAGGGNNGGAGGTANAGAGQSIGGGGGAGAASGSGTGGDGGWAAGGIYNRGTLTIVNTTFIRNLGAGGGGAAAMTFGTSGSGGSAAGALMTGSSGTTNHGSLTLTNNIGVAGSTGAGVNTTNGATSQVSGNDFVTFSGGTLTGGSTANPTVPSNPTTTNLNGDSFTFTEGGAAAVIDQGGNFTITDDGTDYNGGNLTVTISAGKDAAEDVLSFNNTVTLAGTTAGSNVSISGTLIGTLGNNIAAGNDLVVNFTNTNANDSRVQTLVRAITYQDTDTNAPTTGNRTVRTTVNDGAGGTSANADVTVTVAGVNDNPTASGIPATITVTEETPGNLDLSASAFADVDAGSSSVTVTLTAGTGTMAATSGGSVTIGGSGTGTLTLAGTIANINTYLNTATKVQYTGALNVAGNGATTVGITVNDGGNTGSGELTANFGDGRIRWRILGVIHASINSKKGKIRHDEFYSFTAGSARGIF